MHMVLTLLVPSLVLGQVLDNQGATIDGYIALVKNGRELTERLQALDQAVLAGSHDQRMAIMKAVQELAESCHPDELEGLSVAARDQRFQGPMILDYFLSKCGRVYAEDVRERDPLLQMLFETALSGNPMISGETRGKAFRQLMELSPDETTRIKYAIRIVERQDLGVGYLATNYLKHPSRFDEHMHSRFRAILRTSLKKGSPNRLVLSVLGYVGDEHILPSLEQFAAAALAGSEQMRVVQNAIWEINIQHPPGKLVRFLEKGRHDANPVWVVQRAVELGIPKDDLRRALRSYYQKCPAEKLKLFRISALDETVVDLGLLEPDELPNRDW